jgi:hypothetical protein
LFDSRLDNHTPSCKLQVNGTEVVVMKGALDGKKIEGTFEG